METHSLQLHRDHLCPAEVDLQDPYVNANLGLFICHNVLRRTIASCIRHAKSLATSNFEAFLTYTRHTLRFLDDHLRSMEDIYIPVYAEHDSRFLPLLDGHKQLRKEILPIQSLLATPLWKLPPVLPQIADSLAILQEKLYPQFNTLEDFVNQTARQIPLDIIKLMDDRMEERVRMDSRRHGTVWATFFVSRALSPQERELCPFRIPARKLEGILTSGELQFRR
ncbi:hypothetical protein BDV59DRAFT_188355 [Aspergillus ambiguus]|uniref:xanthocillin biosynthesis cluster protein xanF n=1 Tax=Aspergillus ambiguus TaxID=176160 RepID=UPI003CCDAF64